MGIHLRELSEALGELLPGKNEDRNIHFQGTVNPYTAGG